MQENKECKLKTAGEKIKMKNSQKKNDKKSTLLEQYEKLFNETESMKLEEFVARPSFSLSCLDAQDKEYIVKRFFVKEERLIETSEKDSSLFPLHKLIEVRIWISPDKKRNYRNNIEELKKLSISSGIPFHKLKKKMLRIFKMNEP